ncbi:hypothetical protein RRG08_057212 [Elysia crispata]|uniref:Uncharacterized protein n=1 Tax=Elysia crispata TaxID=231223 RepID=A0AAE0XWR4_9GAST|nr:hypothetical protein RRG08_057212 [Elysia crispata]
MHCSNNSAREEKNIKFLARSIPTVNRIEQLSQCPLHGMAESQSGLCNNNLELTRHYFYSHDHAPRQKISRIVSVCTMMSTGRIREKLLNSVCNKRLPSSTLTFNPKPSSKPIFYSGSSASQSSWNKILVETMRGDKNSRGSNRRAI